MAVEKRYVEVLLPLKLKEALIYRLPETAVAAEGTWVRVLLRGHSALGVVLRVREGVPVGIRISSVETVAEILDIPPASSPELAFWQAVADYYLCTPGEVFKAACNAGMQKLMLHPPVSRSRRTRRKNGQDLPSGSNLHALSDGQQDALKAICSGFSQHKPVLLHGVTGSGKTEIYLHLAARALRQGSDVLFLVPEIAISRQLQQRIEAVFGPQLLVFHSRTTIPQRYGVADTLRRDSAPRIVLGTRSAVFLPFRKLGLVIVDEEHDRSYKQDETAPRYNGRDAALMLAALHQADVLLGSATPSCEALYNVQTRKFAGVRLPERYFGGGDPAVEIIDTAQALRLHNMEGSFSRKLLKEMTEVLEAGRQVMVFRSRRAYAPAVQCQSCGEIVKCPHCDVALSYHKFNNTLSCHYCGYHRPWTLRCPSCEELALVERGSGTERLEEELQALFPGRVVTRFDADTTQRKTAADAIIQNFSAGKIDILVGTQMITKGFDFERLAMVVIVSADSLFAVQDFRSDERALQMLVQLMGRSGRRGERGKLVIQTFQPDHPVLQRLLAGPTAASEAIAGDLLSERKQFHYPPFVRLISVTVKDGYEGRVWNVCRLIKEAAEAVGIRDIAGPSTLPVEVVAGEHIAQFWIKLPRNRQLAATKKALYDRLDGIDRDFKGHTTIVIDVDPS